MLFAYKALDRETNELRDGTIEAMNVDVAINALQRRKLVIISVKDLDAAKPWEKWLTFEQKVKYREVVILSRQIATLFKAQISALRIFQLLGSESESLPLHNRLDAISLDIQGGTSLSGAIGKHPEVFSDFYVNMVKAGEESGNLSNTFQFLADYMDRAYELQAKIKNALIYPALVITVFIAVMVLMLVVVIPKLSAIILETGGEIPIYTRITIGLSNLLIHWGLLILAVLAIMGVGIWQYFRTPEGKVLISRMFLKFPYVGDLYRKFYLARIADNLNTMLSSGIPVVHAVEVTAEVVGNKIYADALNDVAETVRGGSSLAAALGRHSEIPGIMVQMVRVGEETGEVGSILDTLAKFYKREVDTTVDTLIGLIEPAMIVLLGIGVGGLLTSILMPIYNLTASF